MSSYSILIIPQVTPEHPVEAIIRLRSCTFFLNIYYVLYIATVILLYCCTQKCGVHHGVSSPTDLGYYSCVTL